MSSNTRYILAIDQGTTGTTALVVDHNLKPMAEASLDFKQHFPKPGWVEHDLEDIWQSVVYAVRKATRGIDAKKITCIGITNQRETLCFWDKQTVKPLARAIVWQDRRTSAMCEKLAPKEALFQKKTGLVVDPYFSGTKASWAFRHWPQIRKAYQEKRLAAGTIDSYLIARLSSGAAHATEPSNASRTLAFHLTEHRWDSGLCNLLDIPLDIWPQVLPSNSLFAKTKGFPGLPDGIPITGVLGDQQAALLGQACVKEGMAKCTFGTGSFILFNTGPKPAQSKHRLLSTIAWALGNKYTYALEGSAFVAGAAVQWFRDGLGLITKASQIETLAKSVSSSDGVVFVPALTGLGAPYWKARAKGLITGITRGTTKAHIARAILEGIAFQNSDILEAMQKDIGKPLKSLNVDGGAAANDLLMQIQADFLGVELRRPKYLETTSLGAVFIAGMGAGIWTSLDDISKTWRQDRIFEPRASAKERFLNLERWHQSVRQM